MNEEFEILVVNDTQETGDLLARTVKRTIPGANIHRADTFEKGLQFTNASLDIAVVDYHLDPNNDERPSGVDLAERIKASARDCYVILVSATVESRPDLHGRAFAIDAYVSLRYVDTNPMARLRDQLRKARDLKTACV